VEKTNKQQQQNLSTTSESSESADLLVYWQVAFM